LVTAETTHLHGLSAGELDAELAALRDQLAELQLPQIAYGRRAIILFEGPEGAGKKHVLRQLVSAFDPCHVAVHRVSYDRREAAEGHWLARFWRQLPAAGETAIFFRSWYRRILDDRILGRTDEAGVARAFDEINEFEAQQRDYGTLIVKLYFDVSAEVQEQRLSDRGLNPWAHATPRDDPVHVRDEAYRRAFHELRTHSDTRWSPWRMIDGNDERKAALTALAAIADAWAQAIPAEAPRLIGEPNQAA
jgi:AMP-polyphosphate phosphotransferase